MKQSLSTLVSLVVFAALFLAGGVAFAHPGHGTTDPASVKHYLLEPVHVGLLAAVAAAVIAWRYASAASWRRRSE